MILRSLRSVLLPAVMAAGLASASAAESRPNILFCIADDASYAHLSANGCTWIQTPGFDRVAHEGLRFTHAYTPNAKCAPSRASILTGRNSWQLEEAGNHWAYFPNKFKSFMESLGERGYWIGFTGKPWSPGIVLPLNGKPRSLNGKAYNKLQITPPTSGISVTDYAANFRQFLKDRPKGEPFCFWYGGWEPHRPYEYGSGVAKGHKSPASIPQVPIYWPDDEKVRNDLLDYGYELEYFDRHLQQMLAMLDEAGELENTIVVVTSDNGMPFPRSKGMEYEISNHMPLAIRWPQGIAHPGRVVDDYVSFIDLAPTFLQAAGVEPAASGMQPIQGRALEAIFQRSEGQPIDPQRDHVLIGREREDVGRPNDEGYPIRGIFQDGWLYLHNFEPTRWPAGDPITGYMDTDGSPTKTLILAQNRQGINHWRWQLSFGLRPADELYDLAKDPGCIDNRAGSPDQAVRQKALHDQLFAELTQQQDPRMSGKGAVFDHYVFADVNVVNFYNRMVVRGEKFPDASWRWIEKTDFEPPGFDPANPIKSEFRQPPAAR